MGSWITSRDHLRKLEVVKKGSEMGNAWDCTMIQFWLLFVEVGLVLHWMGVWKKIQWLLLCLELPESHEVW